VIGDDVALQPYADTLADDPPPPPGLRFAIRSAFVDKESVPEVLQILAEVRASEQSPFIAVRSVGGAVSRVSGDATAYAHCRAELMFVTTSAGPEPIVEAARPCPGSDLGAARTARQRRLRQLPVFRHRGGCRRGLPAGGLQPARGGQAPVRPRRPVRPQPQHLARGYQ
jgi:hypothetical protein